MIWSESSRQLIGYFKKFFLVFFVFFFNDTATTEIYTLSLHDALPIWVGKRQERYGINVVTIQRYGLKLALEVYEKYERKCAICEESTNLVIHHIDGKGKKLERMGLPMNNILSNLIIICRSCHGRLHANNYWKQKNERRK